MYTATRDLMLPTTVTGSWPRPSWYTLGLSGRPLSSGMNDVAFREQFTDALDTVISDQERAGLDILTNGDYHQDPDLGGRSWVLYPRGPARGHVGARHQRHRRVGVSARDDPQRGHAAAGATRWSRASSARAYRSSTPRSGGSRRQRTRPAGEDRDRVGAGRGELHRRCRPTTTRATSTRPCGTWRRRSTRSCAPSPRRAARSSRSRSRMLHLAATAGDRGEVDFLVDAFNHEISGLEDVEVWIHTCWGNPNMQQVDRGHVLRARRRALHGARPRRRVDARVQGQRPARHCELFDRYDGKLPKKVALGMVSHRTLQVESPGRGGRRTSASRSSTWTPSISCCRRTAASAARAFNRLVAFYKSTSLAQGANIVRRELGLPETHVRAADPELQTDVPARVSAPLA